MKIKMLIASLLVLATTACSGGLISEAANAEKEACACADYDCAKKVIAKFNKYSYQNDDQKKSFSDEENKTFMKHVDAMDACRNKLKK